MKVVWKVQLELSNSDQEVILHPMGKLCHVAEQFGYPTMWFEVDPSWGNKDIKRTFRVFGTGHEIPENYDYCGSYVLPPFVWHIYEKFTVE